MQLNNIIGMLQSIMQYSNRCYMILLILIRVMNILKKVLIFVIHDEMKNEYNVYVAYVIIMLIIIT